MYQDPELTTLSSQLFKSNHKHSGEELTALKDLVFQAAKTVGSRPTDRAHLRQHPLLGFSELSFGQGLLRLHSLTGARVWPSDRSEPCLSPPRLRAYKKIVSCCLSYLKKIDQDPSDLWSFFLVDWSRRDDILEQQNYITPFELRSPWLALECLLSQHSSLETRLAFITELLWILPGWASYWADSASDAGRSDNLAAFLVMTHLYAHKHRPHTLRGPDLADQCEMNLHELEKHEAQFRNIFFGTLPRTVTEPSVRQRPRWQALFCIDPRCEPIRTQWEQLEPELDTRSCSGAFALAAQQPQTKVNSATIEKLVEILRSIDLIDNFSRLVLIVGHTLPDENPWHAGFLECTACGGHSGAEHARFTAHALNQCEVRAQLLQRGISIPEDTFFMGGLLHTLPRTIELLDSCQLPDSHAEDLEALKTSLESLTALQPRDRLQTESKALGWQRLSGGAAGNAAMIIAPRSSFRGIDLKARGFLHSYSSQSDESGEILAKILRGALAVALDINLQFYFSAVDPGAWGAGFARTVRSSLKGLRLRSLDNDLTRGIPSEALCNWEGLPHEAMRLQVLISAPEETVRNALRLAPQLSEAWKKEWFTLTLWNKDGSFSTLS